MLSSAQSLCTRALASSVALCYRQQKNCDLQIHCSQGDIPANPDSGQPPPLLCHRLVLASVSPHLGAVLRQSEGADEVSPLPLLLPQCSYDEVKMFLDSVYRCLDGGGGDNDALVVPAGLAGVLGLREDSRWPDVRREEEALKREHDKSVKMEKLVADFDPITSSRLNVGHEDVDEAFEDEVDVDPDFVVGVVDGDEDDDDVPLSQTRPGKRKRGRPRKNEGEKMTTAKRKKNQLHQEELDEEISPATGDPTPDEKPSQNGVDVDPSATAEMLGHAMQTSLGQFDRVQLVRKSAEEWLGQKQLPFMARKSYFRAIVGLRNRSNTSSSHFLAKPLAWSDPSTEEALSRQFDWTVRALQGVFGFSSRSLSHSSLLCSRQGVVSGSFRKRKHDDVFKEHRGKSRDELGRILSELDARIAEAERTDVPAETASRRRRRAASQYEDAGPACLQLAERLAGENDDDDVPDDLAVLVWRRSGGGRSSCLCYPLLPLVDAIKSERDKAAETSEGRAEDDAGAAAAAQAGEICLRSLFEVWCTSSKRIPKSKYLLATYQQASVAYFHREALRTLLSEDQLPEKQCTECGMLFAYLTKKDKQKFRAHADLHERDKFTCDCQVPFDAANEKRRHILLAHSGGKYGKCCQCAYIGTPAQVRTHEQTNHKSYVCDVCGKTVPTKAALSVHALDHKSYTCGVCHAEILGRHKYARHMDTQHSGTWACEEGCGATFKSQLYMRKHVLIMHRTDAEKPHRCQTCGKGFVGSNQLKTHMMNVHIKSRPYACRYGCGAAYNDTSNRGHHERKKHGGNYEPPAVAAARS